MGTNQIGMFILIFVPWVLFQTLLVPFIYLYHHYFMAVYMIVFGGFAVSGCLILINASRQKGAAGGNWYLYLGILCLIACIAATWAGLYVYYTKMFFYYNYMERRTYTDVLPIEPASAHMDAGKMVFARDARVDVTRSVGFAAGSYYCVAPILDDEGSIGTRVEYWAAGVDCCSARGDFACDGAWDPKAKSGLVVLDTGLGWLFPSPLENFKKAVKEAEGAYRFVAPKNPILVRWVTNPLSFQNAYHGEAMGFYIMVTAVHFLWSIIAGYICQRQSKKR